MTMKTFDPKTAARLWCELNCGKFPKELSDVKLETLDARLECMNRIAEQASKAEANKIWAEHNAISEARLAQTFGHE